MAQKRAVFPWTFGAYAALVPGRGPSTRLVAGFRRVPWKTGPCPPQGSSCRGDPGAAVRAQGARAPKPRSRRETRVWGKRGAALHGSASPRWWLGG